MVYDLGGGTFDVSIVTIEGDVTEVLASHGNNQLGGDDFADLLVGRLADEFQERYRLDLRHHAAAQSRLWWAAEEAKQRLSYEQYATVREEALVVEGGRALHLEREISREEYEELIRPLAESTLQSVAKAMDDARMRSGDLDAILVVGGTTRTPLITRLLEERTGLTPRQEVHPDLCVALGAGVLASRLDGRQVDRVLVDVSPYSFGPSYLGDRGGAPYPHCYQPVIRRQTPLPVTRTERYSTAFPYQREVDVTIYQGDDPDALKNLPVGRFRIEGLQPTEEPNEVLCRMSLDLDGILRVTAIEKQTGKSKQVTITQALRPKSAEELASARRALETLYAAGAVDLAGMFTAAGEEPGGGVTLTAEAVLRELPADGPGDPPVAEGGELLDAESRPGADTAAVGPAWADVARDARRIVERSRALLAQMHDDDQADAIGLHETIEEAIARSDHQVLPQAVAELKELLFFVEGR